MPKIDYNRRSFSKRTLPKDIGFLKTNEFVTPGQQKKKELQQKLEGGVVDVSIFKRHISMGEIRYNGNKVIIMCRDFGMEDGDKIQIYLNDVIVQGVFTMTNRGAQVHVPLQDGFNNIEIQAVNMGVYAPNTAQFIMTGENNKELLMEGSWNLATGFKARFLIVKE